VRFTDKVCLVTGGGSGIGQATCRRFAAEGGRVVVVDIDEERGAQTAREIAGTGGQAIFALADVAVPEQVRAAIQQAVATWQKIDVVVNNAAMMTFDPVVSLDEAAWDKVLAVNLRSVFLFSKYSLPHMSRGAIVNVSSVHAHQTTANVAPYAASKGAIEAFTRQLSREVTPAQARVNAVAPGAVDTPMLWSNPNVKSGREKIEGAIAKPDEIAAVIAFVASDEASFVHGTVIIADGGRLDIL
jgi:NAD(P)-dependent dehydrogenase (short-subunit alcohol dehydrogenase family)